MRRPTERWHSRTCTNMQRHGLLRLPRFNCCSAYAALDTLQQTRCISAWFKCTARNGAFAHIGLLTTTKGWLCICLLAVRMLLRSRRCMLATCWPPTSGRQGRCLVLLQPARADTRSGRTTAPLALVGRRPPLLPPPPPPRMPASQSAIGAAGQICTLVAHCGDGTLPLRAGHISVTKAMLVCSIVKHRT